jgi:hypothetical protein
MTAAISINEMPSSIFLGFNGCLSVNAANTEELREPLHTFLSRDLFLRFLGVIKHRRKG